MKFNKVYLENQIPEFEDFYINYRYCKFLQKKQQDETLKTVIETHKNLLGSYLNDLGIVKSELLSLVRWNNHAYEKLKIPFDVALDIYFKTNISISKSDFFKKIIAISRSKEYNKLIDNNISKERIELDISGRNALHYACIIGDLEMVKFLISKSVEYAYGYDAFGYCPIDLALKNNFLTISVCIRENCHQVKIGYRLNILATVIKSNNLQIAKVFINEFNSVHLYYACLYNRPSIVRLFLEYGIRPEFCKDSHFTNQNLLHLCAIDGDRVDCLRLLLSTGFLNPEVRDLDGWNPLDHAMYRFHRLSIEALKPYYTCIPLKDRVMSLKPRDMKTFLRSRCFLTKSPWIRTFVDTVPQEMYRSKEINVLCILAFKSPLQELLHLTDTDYFSLEDVSTNTRVEVSPIENFSNFYYFCLSKRNIYHFVARYNNEVLDIFLSPTVVETGAYLMIFEKQDIVIEMVFHFIYINDGLRNQIPIEIPYPLVIGHRGSGDNYELLESGTQALMAAENTIKSFAEMHMTYGSCCIEFDVQMTLDKIPVIYHDWLVPETGFDSIGLHSLRLEDLKKLKTKQRIIYDEKYERYWKSVSKEEIPTLQEVFELIDEQVAFNIEIKFPHEEESNRFNLNDELPSINQYCDIILDCISKHCQPNRKIILSSFHPEVTIALKFKQCKYPVFYLTECGGTYTWDLRWQSIQQALRFAVQCNLDGIVCDSKIFYWSPIVMQKIIDSTPNVWTYGKYNTNEEHIKFQYASGVKGLITDTFGIALKVVNSLL